MTTRHYHASWLSTVELPNGTQALRIFLENNDTQIPNAVLYTTPRQWAGVKRQKPIKLKKLKKGMMK